MSFLPTDLMQVQPVTLEGEIVRLIPLQADHAPALFAAADVSLFEYFVIYPQAWTLPDFEDYIHFHLQNPATCFFTVMLKSTHEPIGMTSYLDIRPIHRGLEIGNTWISRAYHGTKVNPEQKYLLLRHAFETLHALRVQLKTDSRNHRSQRAIEKLGAQKEGILRQHIVIKNGYVRDTVMYSIIHSEWPQIRAYLERRLKEEVRD